MSSRPRRATAMTRPLDCFARLPRVSLALLLLLVGLAAVGPGKPEPVEATHTNIKFPFASGTAWYISQGYNTSPAEGWSHWNCDPVTQRDQISQTTSCGAGYQYKYSFDLRRSDGQDTGTPVLSPVDGTIRWIDNAFGGMSINLNDGYAVAFFHANLVGGLAPGQSVRMGQQLGTVAGPGGGGNGGTPHVHLTIWQTTDGGNWSRNAVPFTDTHRLDGYDFPALGDGVRNQHYLKTVYSTNVLSGATGLPATPGLQSPATGTAFAAGTTPTLTWAASSGALEYQVVLDDGALTSPWSAATSWQTGPLAAGEHAWQVRARNYTGWSPISARWTFTIGSTPSPSPSPSPGAASVNLGSTTGGVGSVVTVNGSGYGANESVNLHWDSTATAALVQATANASGAWSASLTVPNAVRGAHAVIARGAATGRQGSASFTVTPSLARTPTEGAVGTGVAVTVKGFGANESVKLTWDGESGPTLGTATTNALGTGSVTIAIPDASNGWHNYTGLGLSSGARGWGAMRVLASIGLDPPSGARGASTTPRLRGFPANTAVTVSWNRTASAAGTTVCSGTTSAQGVFVCSFAVPTSAMAGAGYPVVGVAGGVTAAALFTVTGAGNAAITLSPATGFVGGWVTVNATGFAAGETVAAHWGTSTAPRGSAVTNASGAASFTTTVPPLPAGVHTVTGKGATSGRTAQASFTVAPNLTLSPTSGPSGTAITVRGYGFDANAGVSIYWNRTGGAAGINVCGATTNASGSFTCGFSALSGAANTGYPVVAVSGSRTARATFTLTGSSFAAQGLDASSAQAEMTVPNAAPGHDGSHSHDDPDGPEASPSPSPSADPSASPAPGPETATATPTPTPEATPVATETPTPEATPAPTVPPEPVSRELVFLSVADASVLATTPDVPQLPAEVGVLKAGGPDVAIAFLTFQVEGIGAGTVVDARLVLTGAGEQPGPGGTVVALHGVAIDEATLTLATAPLTRIDAAAATGAVANLSWIAPWGEATVGVTGAIVGDGQVTFVIVGDPTAATFIASRESAAPPRLLVTVQEPAPA